MTVSMLCELRHERNLEGIEGVEHPGGLDIRVSRNTYDVRLSRRSSLTVRTTCIEETSTRTGET